MNTLKGKNEAVAHKKEVALETAQDLAHRLEGLSVKITAKAGESGKLFGSVTTKEISAAIEEQTQVTVDKKKIVLDEPIKDAGETPVIIKIYPTVSAKINVKVTV